jgi:hypothetical protein
MDSPTSTPNQSSWLSLENGGHVRFSGVDRGAGSRMPGYWIWCGSVIRGGEGGKSLHEPSLATGYPGNLIIPAAIAEILTNCSPLAHPQGSGVVDLI